MSIAHETPTAAADERTGSTPQERYREKLFVGSSHTWALRHLADLPASSRVLDIGAGSGLIGKQLRSRGVTNVTAVEISPEAREYIQSFYERVEANLDHLESGSFDAIILLDVLEHTVDPFSFFGHAWKLLKPGGMMLISVPNIAHWSIRLSLLFGYFEYTERGLLDRTHYSFFNHRRLSTLLASAPDLMVFERSASISPAEFVLPESLCNNAAFRLLSHTRRKVAHLLPGLCAFQLLAAATKLGSGKLPNARER